MTKITEKYDTAIIGLGKTGMSCVRYLSAKGESLVVLDSRKHPPELDNLLSSYPNIKVQLGPFDASVLLSAQKIVISPGIASSIPEIKKVIENTITPAGTA